MGFKDYITSRRYRRQLAAQMERFQTLRPPENPTPRYIKKRVSQLLHPHKVDFALKELDMLGEHAVPALLAALNDPRFVKREPPKSISTPDPLNAVIGLLGRHEPERVLKFLHGMAGSSAPADRKIIATHAAATGQLAAIPMIVRSLEDADGYVRSSVLYGVQAAIESQRMEDGYREHVYGLLLAQCDQKWPISGNRSLQTMIRLDRERTGRDLANNRLLTLDNPNLLEVLLACRSESMALPPCRMHTIFEDAIERVGGERSFPYDRIAEVVLVMLAKSGVPDEVRALIDRATRIENDRLQEAVADAAAQLAGVDDPVSFVQKHINRVGYDRLTQPQRVVYCASCFDAEVCNGGLMQFFGNSSGDHAVDTLEALEQLAHTEAVTALTKAMHAVGPLARETDRDTRMDAFAGRFDELVEVFRPLEGAFYKTNSGLRARMTQFAVEHAEDFR